MAVVSWVKAGFSSMQHGAHASGVQQMPHVAGDSVICSSWQQDGAGGAGSRSSRAKHFPRVTTCAGSVQHSDWALLVRRPPTHPPSKHSSAVAVVSWVKAGFSSMQHGAHAS